MTGRMSNELPLRRQVGEALGYSVYHYNKGPRDYWMLMDPEYNAVVWHPFREGERATEAEAWADLPAFDTNMDAAWEVVEAVRARGYQWQFEDRGTYWVASAWPTRKRRTAGDVWADDDMLRVAICKAAIEVLRRLKEGIRYAQP